MPTRIENRQVSFTDIILANLDIIRQKNYAEVALEGAEAAEEKNQSLIDLLTEYLTLLEAALAAGTATAKGIVKEQEFQSNVRIAQLKTEIENIVNGKPGLEE